MFRNVFIKRICSFAYLERWESRLISIRTLGERRSFHTGIRNTMKVLSVAEKNDAAKHIAGYLSRGALNRRDGLSKYNKIYEFDIRLWNQNCKMVMTSVSGHLLHFDFPGTYRQWRGCHPGRLFDAPVVKGCNEDMTKIKRTLEKEIRGCGALIIWTDCDREGENIGYEIIDVCQAIKSSIKVYRAKFSEITQTSIDRAIRTLEEPNKLISDAVDVRIELDLRIGAAFTRFQTLRLQKIFSCLSDKMVSYGPCQFPTLGFVVERFLAIERFQSEPYWKIKVMDIRDDLAVEFRWSRNRLFEKLPCEIFLEMCQDNPEAKVEKVTSKPKSKWRPLPLDTVELEKQCSRKLRINAKTTMKIAEKLYTQGFISYPRTETNIFPKDFNLVSLVNQQAPNPNWGAFASRVAEEGPNPRAGKKNDGAHPPIHPTKYCDSLQGDEKKIYEYVVRHFLACLSKDAEGFETIVNIDIAGEKFLTNGLQVIAKNYLEVYIYETWNGKLIHVYEEGQRFQPTSIDMSEEKTSPPNLLTEADLISLMDKHGIGTDATHAEHIDTIKSREYIGVVDNKYLIPGKLGIGLVMGYDRMGFEMSKPNLRAELENDLKLICDGAKNKNEVLDYQIQKYRSLFNIAVEKANLIDNSLTTYLNENPANYEGDSFPDIASGAVIFKCPKCGSDMTLKNRKSDKMKYIGCATFPMCKNVIWFPNSVTDVEPTTEICTTCPGDMHKLKFKFNTNVLAHFGSVYTTCIGGCDDLIIDMLNINLGNVKNISGARNNNSTQRERPQPTRHVSRVSAPAQNTTQSRPRSSSGVNRSHQGFGDNNGNAQDKGTWGNGPEEEYSCHCGTQAKQFTVRKDGPNKGRLFYKCAKPQESGCDFFLWVSEADNGNQTVTGNFQSNTREYNNQNTNNQTMNNRGYNNQNANNQTFGSGSYNNSRQNNRGESSNDPWNSEVMCKCRKPARLLTVNKDGPNKGRQFYGCPDGPSSKCNFFQWADESSSGGNRTTYENNSRSTSRGRQAGGNSETTRKPRATGAKRKCGICGVEGHTRKTCPRNAND